MRFSDSNIAKSFTFRFSLLLGVLLALLFWMSFVPGYVHFSNDGPLGAQMAAFIRPALGITGMWNDLNSIGGAAGSLSPCLTTLVSWLGGPVGYSKFIQLVSLMVAGICACFYFGRVGLAPLAMLLGSLALVLNADFFSIACWGLGSMPFAVGMSFLACGLVVSANRCSTKLGYSVRLALAGFAVGTGIIEAADNGAIFSLMIAGYMMCLALVKDGPLLPRLATGISQTTIVALFAAFLAAHTIFALVSTQVQGVAGAQQDTRSRAERWGWATQWSLPKREALGIVVPGLFGYRMDTPDGGNYWGLVGSDPSWDTYLKDAKSGKQGASPIGYPRFIGGGYYAGVPVLLVAFWAVFQSFRRKGSVFDIKQRKILWFWAAMAVVGLLLGFGRFAPFYQFVYALPYFSSIRNPIKFLHVFNFALVILFAYGVDALWRTYFQTTLTGARDLSDRLKTWWSKAAQFDRKWVFGCAAVLAAGVVGWLIFSSSRTSFEEYLQLVQFDPDLAHQIAGFSIRQVGWFVLFFVLSAGVLVLIFSGAFAGRRANWGGAILGLLVVIDLARANQPWIKYVDYGEKYATNPIIELLRNKPYEQRVAILPFRSPQQLSMLDQLYRIEWAQHHFPYFNIQSLDVIQMPRMPEDLAAFETAIRFDGSTNTLYRTARRWQLTSTRYLLGAAGFLDVLNRDLDPVQHRFRIAAAFDVVPRPGVSQPRRLEELTAVMKPGGPYALFEFTGALPRASLYTRWQTSTNDQATLAELGSPAFDPAQSVLVSAALNSPGTATNAAGGTVEYTGYSPKRIALKADAKAPSVLLLNDKFDPNWKVSVDGKPSNLLRCNFIMRGVYLTPGLHNVVFSFEPPIGTLYITIVAMGVGVLLIVVLIISKRFDKAAG